MELKLKLFMKNWIVSCLCLFLFCACVDDKVNYSYTLQPADTFLKYELDSDVKMPLLIRTTMGKNNYLCFQNFSSSELLIYDILSGSLVKRIRFEEEGANAIRGGFLRGFMMADCNRIFISGSADGSLYETDTTGCIKNEIRFSKSGNEYCPHSCSDDNGQMELIDGKLYLPQGLNWQLGDKVMESLLMCCVDMSTGDVKPLPVTFPNELKKERVVKGGPTSIVSKYKFCFDGHRFVYSFAYSDELMIVDAKTFQVSYKSGKSHYISNVGVPTFRSDDIRNINRTLLETPAYDKILYDNENKVYYRIVYVPQEIEKDKDLISLLRYGRKQFSIMIYDENFNVIGEELFPEYTYNPQLSFVYKGSLYISTNHVMSPDYSDDILSFQKIDLVKL